MKTNTRILRELADRMKANSNGSLLFFQNAGITISGEYPTIKELKNLYETNYGEFEKLIKFLYEEELKTGVANADGTQPTNADKGWELANNAISTTGSVLSSIFGGRMGGVQSQTTTAEVEDKKSNTMLYIIIGVVVLILIGGCIYYFKKK